MSYFGGSSGMVGDPGFFGTLFGGAKRLFRGAVSTATGGPVAGASALFAPPRSSGGRPRGIPVIKTPGFKGGIQRALPGGKTGFEVGVDMRPRRRRMNAGNAKALRRAIRRTDAFVRLSRGALKNTGFKIVSKSAGRMTEAQWQKRAHHAK